MLVHTERLGESILFCEFRVSGGSRSRDIEDFVPRSVAGNIAEMRPNLISRIDFEQGEGRRNSRRASAGLACRRSSLSLSLAGCEVERVRPAPSPSLCSASAAPLLDSKKKERDFKKEVRSRAVSKNLIGRILIFVQGHSK